MGAMRSWSFAKGQATLNDFIVVNDRHGLLSPSREDVQFLCNRRAGIGADGLLRAIKASHVPGWSGPGDVWYMDARSNDGEPADFGGNGLRVFVRYLRDAGLVSSDVIRVGTRSGLREAELLPDGRIRTVMGSTRTAGMVDVACDDELIQGTVVFIEDRMHVVCTTDHLTEIEPDETRGLVAAAKCSHELRNVEYMQPLGADKIKIKAWEAGIGETVSIGSGAVAAAAVRRAQLEEERPDFRCKVEVPGGRLEVVFDGDAAALIGPAELTARGDVLLPDPESNE